MDREIPADKIGDGDFVGIGFLGDEGFPCGGLHFVGGGAAGEGAHFGDAALGRGCREGGGDGDGGLHLAAGTAHAVLDFERAGDGERNAGGGDSGLDEWGLGGDGRSCIHDAFEGNGVDRRTSARFHFLGGGDFVADRVAEFANDQKIAFTYPVYRVADEIVGLIGEPCACGLTGGIELGAEAHFTDG